jgi:SsrA-binding protein
MAGEKKLSEKTLAVNKKAKFHYSVSESLECGIELQGTEVKSLKAGRFSYSDCYAKIENNELWLTGLHIAPYEFGNRFNHDPDRQRRLLVHIREIKRLQRKVREKGLTLVPLRFYLKKSMVKLELGIGKGKKLVDKRETIKRRDLKLDMEREFRNK